MKNVNTLLCIYSLFSIFLSISSPFALVHSARTHSLKVSKQKEGSETEAARVNDMNILQRSHGDELIHQMVIARRALVKLERDFEIKMVMLRKEMDLWRELVSEKNKQLPKDVDLEEDMKMQMTGATDVKRAQRKNELIPGCYTDDNGELRCTSTYPDY